MIPEPRLSDLYQEVILDHNRRPRNFKKLAKPTHYSHGVNPLCGDDYHLYLKTGEDGTIRDIGFEGSGCAISKASASMLTELIKGKKLKEASGLREHFLVLMTRDPVTPEARSGVGKLKIFEGVKEFPVRVKCATLIWQALGDILRDAGFETREKG